MLLRLPLTWMTPRLCSRFIEMPCDGIRVYPDFTWQDRCVYDQMANRANYTQDYKPFYALHTSNFRVFGSSKYGCGRSQFSSWFDWLMAFILFFLIVTLWVFSFIALVSLNLGIILLTQFFFSHILSVPLFFFTSLRTLGWTFPSFLAHSPSTILTHKESDDSFYAAHQRIALLPLCTALWRTNTSLVVAKLVLKQALRDMTIMRLCITSH